ncbi:uncharacterized protein N7503_001257 [Penicillium pulvis]|uniref:uncharacterized protein n=1 Tax=Penicillium pulvis TaxID=1562058 RepID=UPI002549380C|nr:uncharacterized protein N7503_001257 [Penicillium pulvis]KAJ5809039.1 hypothetical protein N7503_001257 [Penicillium pulvis]
MEAHAWQKGGCLIAPPGAITGEWESRQAYVRAPWHAPPDVFILERDEAMEKHAEISKSQNQAALQALLRPRMPSGQVYLRGAIKNLQKLADQDIQVELRWIPAHQGIPGNELVDKHAKQAAKAEADTPGPHDRHIKLAAAAKRGIRERAKITWEAAWEKEKSGKATKQLIPVPTKKVLDY